MYAVKEYKVLDDYRIWISFDDGFEKTVNLKPILNKGIAADLLNPKSFGSVTIESGGGLAWENGFDICPNYLREITEATRQMA